MVKERVYGNSVVTSKCFPDELSLFYSEVHLINVGDADAASSQEAIHLKSLCSDCWSLAGVPGYSCLGNW